MEQLMPAARCWLYCGRQSTMQTIQVVLDEKLLKAADRAAKRENVNRSALIRQALEEHLKRLHLRELEERDRRGYQVKPQQKEEYRPWEDTAAWPQD
jgi:metal-responsive CopG/Arc/MetJ family transcriptional regulator